MKSPEFLSQRWFHSHEEDTDTETVFRPSSFSFPPSRGRMGFELKPDGRALALDISARDGLEEQAGEWNLEDEKSLIVKLSNEHPPRKMEILSAAPEKLIVKK